jgi:O-antigen/teichoic acid export membrane protein
MTGKSQQLFFNASSVFAKTIVLMAIGIILPPFVIGHIGRAEYGLVVLISSFFALLQMVQLGIPQSLNRYVPRELQRADNRSVSGIISSGFVMLCFCGVLVAIGAVLTALHPNWLAKTPSEASAGNISALIVILGLAAAIDLPMSLGHVIFQAHEQYIRHSILQTLGYGTRFILVLVLLTLFPGNIIAYVGGMVGGNLIQGLLILIVALIIFRETKIKIAAINISTIVKIGKYGFLTLLNTIGIFMFIQADYLVIGKLISNEAITVFSLGVAWVLLVRSYINAAMSVVTPAAARIEFAGKPEALKEMLLRTTKYGLLVSMLPLVFIAIFRETLMKAWMGQGYDQSAEILLFVLIGDILANGVAGGTSMLIGLGKLRKLTAANLIAGILNILLGVLLLLVFNLGVMSFAYSYCLIFIILNGLVVPAILSHALNLSLRFYYKNAWLRPAAAGILSLPVAILIHRIATPRGWAGIVICATIFLFGYSLSVFLVAYDKYDKHFIKSTLQALLGKQENKGP